MAKEFKWQGLAEEEIKNLDLKEFLKLIPARARRSLKRGHTEDQKTLLSKIEKNEKNIKTHCRNLIIMPQMIGLSIGIYNGRTFVPLIITAEMLGHTLGEFSQSRKNVSHSAAGVGATRSSKAISAR
ncbi:30S ribosomal protein S19 [Candidatus Woesearchaeota archaeon]|jgi:small subunit ribosomal protein S19|nr:30S ribosomal protein S19 [Candidatus Woesearchaeota archaeon]